MHLSICGSSYLMGESILLLMTGLSVASWSCAAVIEVSCLILNLDSVECTWRGQVNYTFYSRLVLLSVCVCVHGNGSGLLQHLSGLQRPERTF